MVNGGSRMAGVTKGMSRNYVKCALLKELVGSTLYEKIQKRLGGTGVLLIPKYGVPAKEVIENMYFAGITDLRIIAARANKTRKYVVRMIRVLKKARRERGLE